MKNNVEMVFDARIENVTFARGVVASFLLNHDLTLNTINEIKTIVSEAVTNSIVHGYLSDDTKKVFLDLVVDEEMLTIIIKDKGVGIENIDQAREPLFSTKPSEERAGLGFTIMDIFSDSLVVESNLGKGTTIICKKRLNQGA